MKKQLLIVGITLVLLFIGLSGCTSDDEGTRIFGNMKLTSSAFTQGNPIPLEYTCDGDDVSPLLTFSDVPDNATSLVLIMDDPDAPSGTWVHWIVWNIPSSSTGLSTGEVITFPQGTNDNGELDYGGPCPPSGTHHYYFKLYALDTMLNLNEGATKNQVVNAMSGHIIEEAELMGTYSY